MMHQSSSEHQTELCCECKVLFLYSEDVKFQISEFNMKIPRGVGKRPILPAVLPLLAVQFVQGNIGWCRYLKWMLIMGCLLSIQITNSPADIFICCTVKCTFASFFLNQGCSSIFT